MEFFFAEREIREKEDQMVFREICELLVSIRIRSLYKSLNKLIKPTLTQKYWNKHLIY